MKLPSRIENLIRYISPTFHLNHKGNLLIERDCYFDSAEMVEFGKNVFVNKKVQFHTGNGHANIKIGNAVWIGMDVCFVCPSHEIGLPSQRAGKSLFKDIIIEDGVWIGARSTILPGVTIGAGSVIAAGSVVSCSLEANCLWGGVPAKKIKQL